MSKIGQKRKQIVKKSRNKQRKGRAKTKNGHCNLHCTGRGRVLGFIYQYCCLQILSCLATFVILSNYPWELGTASLFTLHSIDTE